MELISTVVGWVLGVATTPLVRYFERRSKRDSLAAALKSEVAELREQAVASASYVWLKRGRTGRRELEWELRMLQREPQSELSKQGAARIVEQLKLTDAQLAQLFATAVAEDTGISPQNFDLPFLVAHITEISLFDLAVQQQLLRLLKESRFCNGIASEVREAYRMTFTPELSSGTFKVVTENLRLQEERLAQRAQILADAADELLVNWN